MTGDARHCQRSRCRQIRAAGGDYLAIVKENQPTLLADIQTLFAEPPPGEHVASATQRDRGHGRLERRRLWASAALTDYLDWPGAGQVGLVERVVQHGTHRDGETSPFVTSLGPELAATQLLAVVRGHWRIENRLHCVRDVTLGEDANRIRTGAAPQVMAALRNAVLNLLRARGATNIAAALRQIGWQGSALAILGLLPS